MRRSEKMLYHQIHPAKLLTDVGSSLASAWLVWESRWLEAALVGLLPSVVVTAFLVGCVNLERWRKTRLGNYVEGHMPRSAVMQRILGQIIVWAGAGLHVLWLVPFGYFVVVLAWVNGLWDPLRGGPDRVRE